LAFFFFEKKSAKKTYYVAASYNPLTLAWQFRLLLLHTADSEGFILPGVGKLTILCDPHPHYLDPTICARLLSQV